jgi:hypothetical protein
MKPQFKKQIEYEIDSWKRFIFFIQEENMLMKKRLAEIIQNEKEKQLLEFIEYYQNTLIMEDNVSALCRKDIMTHENNIKIYKSGDKQFFLDHKKLRKDIELIERFFNKLKFEFNTFFSEKLN